MMANGVCVCDDAKGEVRYSIQSRMISGFVDTHM